MSMATLERAILAGARGVLKNPKLRMKDIIEWSCSNVSYHDGEIAVYVPDPGVNVCVAKDADKRS